LSLLSAVVYILATISLARSGPVWRTIALSSVIFELIGVLAVGGISLIVPELFVDASIWSGFGSGYGYLPLVLPVLGLLWIRKTNQES
jgi:hypothetical protein